MLSPAGLKGVHHGRIDCDLDRVIDGDRSHARPELDLLGQRGCLDDEHVGDRQRVDLDQVLCFADSNDNLLALDEALLKLAEQEPAKAEIVKLRYFAGLTLEEAAACMGISEATAKRYWLVARAWLFDALS